MIDLGLLLTVVIVTAVVAVASRLAPHPLPPASGLVDRLITAAGVGLLVGRATAAALDDPASLRSLRAFLVIRGGVEFWPGVAAALLALLWLSKRHREPGPLMVAEMLPFLLWGYATFEATCLVRDGCYGPRSAFGLTPSGLDAPQLPIGIIVGLATASLALLLRRLWSWGALEKILLAAGGIAGVRAVAAVWLPRLGETPTRPHRESVAVLMASIAGGLAVGLRRRRRQAGDAVSPDTGATR